jgi:hypothetical protein
MLAKPQTQDDHALATGRRFKFRLPPPFSSRLSRYSPRDNGGLSIETAVQIVILGT